MNAYQVYRGSDGAVTRRFYAELVKRGLIGAIAVNLFRAQKSSRRAKKYGPTAYRGLAYERKGWSLRQLCDLLQHEGAALGIGFGWGRDEHEPVNKWVLYIDLPEFGQCSFHSPERYAGPDYPGEWDGRRLSEERIIAFCQQIFDMRAAK